MPIYSYKSDDGQLVERLVLISERDNQTGLTRIRDAPGSVWAPTATGGGMK